MGWSEIWYMWFDGIDDPNQLRSDHDHLYPKSQCIRCPTCSDMSMCIASYTADKMKTMLHP